MLPLKGGFGKEHYALAELRFENDHSVVLNFDRSRSSSGDPTTAVLRLDSDGSWENIPNSEDPKLDALPFRAEVRQDLNHSPVITVEDRRKPPMSLEPSGIPIRKSNISNWEWLR